MTTPRPRFFVLLSLLFPSLAQACGGLFCSSINLIPVEQNAERVVLEVNDDGTITATVEIRYSGAPQDFSWVVPVAGVPSLDIAPASALAVLDTVTRPTISSFPDCFEDDYGYYGCSSAGPRVDTPKDASLLPSVGPLLIGGCATSYLGEEERDASDPVEVVTLPQTGPYESAVVSSDDPEALIEWLRENNYVVTPAMEPAITHYVDAGDRFLAMKLAPEAEVSEIAPISITFSDKRPMVPLVLTSVAAEPEMGIVVWVVGRSRFRAANYGNLLIDPQDVRVDGYGFESNYHALVSALIDDRGGRAFVTEMSGSTEFVESNMAIAANQFPEVLEWWGDLSRRQPEVTRFYARMSAEEMTEDPVFEEFSGGEIPQNLDLYGAPSACTALPCGTVYCGVSSSCVEVDGLGACDCADGTVARQITLPDLFSQGTTLGVTCQDATFDMLDGADELVDPSTAIPNPCVMADCGLGVCEVVGGFATCDCDPGSAAISSLDGGVQCVEVPSGSQVWSGRDALDWDTDVAAETDAPGGGGLFSVLPALLLLGRRRR